MLPAEVLDLLRQWWKARPTAYDTGIAPEHRWLLPVAVIISLFRVGYQPAMKKVVSDRRASLDEETEVKPAMRKLVEDEFRRGASIPVVPFPHDGAEIPDTPRLTLIVADPEAEWSGAGALRAQLGEWTRSRGKSPRLYPGALVWCLKKPGRDLRDKVELGLAWKRVAAPQVLSCACIQYKADRTWSWRQ
jgi:hypothetical protein